MRTQVVGSCRRQVVMGHRSRMNKKPVVVSVSTNHLRLSTSCTRRRRPDAADAADAASSC